MSTLMTEYSLHGRDFLAIHPGTHRNTPCILAREKAILINLNTIRGIITEESMIIFNVVYYVILFKNRLTIHSFRRFRVILQIIFGMLPLFLWRKLNNEGKDSRPRLDSVLKVYKFCLIMLIDSLLIFVGTGILNHAYSVTNFISMNNLKERKKIST